MVADECKIQKEPNPSYRWNPIGKTPITRVDRDKTQGFTVYGGLSMIKKKVIAFFGERSNAKGSIQFLERIKAYRERRTKRTKKNLPILLVWDNAIWHKCKEVKEWLKENPGVVELMNTPPYTPEVNPQEHVWKKLKQCLAQFRLYEYDMNEIKNEARIFLKSSLFDYKFF